MFKKQTPSSKLFVHLVNQSQFIVVIYVVFGTLFNVFSDAFWFWKLVETESKGKNNTSVRCDTPALEV